MDTYFPLQKLFYADSLPHRNATIHDEAKSRLHEASTFRTGIEIAAGELFLAVPKELTVINEKLLRVERKVSQLWHELPGMARWAYLRGLILDEIFSTNEIEGVRSTRRQIEEALESAELKAHTTDGKRFREFANLYLELTNKSHIYPETPRDIRKIYDAVVAGELAEGDQPDGILFRKESVDVTDTAQNVIHSGVTPESTITKMLEQMISLVNSKEMPPTFSALLAHFLFEYIHPFYDGNGRTGRYLLALYLSEPLSLATVLSLSAVIAENKSKYYKAFKSAESLLNYGEATFFVIQMMEFIRLAQDSVMENLEHKKLLLKRAEESLNRFEAEPYSLTPKEVKIVFLAAQFFLFNAFPEISLKDIAEYSGVSVQTARKHTLKLEEKALLQTVSLKPMKFVLTQRTLEILDIVEM